MPLPISHPRPDAHSSFALTPALYLPIAVLAFSFISITVVAENRVDTGATGALPEPSTLVLLLVGALGVVLARHNPATARARRQVRKALPFSVWFKPTFTGD